MHHGGGQEGRGGGGGWAWLGTDGGGRRGQTAPHCRRHACTLHSRYIPPTHQLTSSWCWGIKQGGWLHSQAQVNADHQTQSVPKPGCNTHKSAHHSSVHVLGLRSTAECLLLHRWSIVDLRKSQKHLVCWRTITQSLLLSLEHQVITIARELTSSCTTNHTQVVRSTAVTQQLHTERQRSQHQSIYPQPLIAPLFFLPLPNNTPLYLVFATITVSSLGKEMGFSNRFLPESDKGSSLDSRVLYEYQHPILMQIKTSTSSTENHGGTIPSKLALWPIKLFI